MDYTRLNLMKHGMNANHGIKKNTKKDMTSWVKINARNHIQIN